MKRELSKRNHLASAEHVVTQDSEHPPMKSTLTDTSMKERKTSDWPIASIGFVSLDQISLLRKTVKWLAPAKSHVSRLFSARFRLIVTREKIEMKVASCGL